jgi:hypothetical protein
MQYALMSYDLQLILAYMGVLPGLLGSFAVYGTRCVWTAHGT